MKRGHILSRFLFRFCIRDVVSKLTGTGYKDVTLVNLLCYADDVVLLSLSWSTALQSLMLVEEAAYFSRYFNSKKTVCSLCC